MRPLVLAATDRKLRRELARYLEGAGFTVEELDSPSDPDATRSLVWLTDRRDDPKAIAAMVSAWLEIGAPRIIVVAWKLTMLRALYEAHGARLAVLPPPVFGWQVIDALRAPMLIE
jgi:hypothetical protein